MIVKVDKKLCIDMRAREWCLLPYPGHPKGCPNYDKKKICPPKIETVEKIFDLDRDIWFAIVEFDLNIHMSRMIEKHQDWSIKQAKCVLYWQGTVRKKLRLLATSFIGHKKLIWTDCPEAMGVNIFKTFRRLGLPIERHPEIVRKVALIGHPLKEQEEMHENGTFDFYH